MKPILILILIQIVMCTSATACEVDLNDVEAAGKKIAAEVTAQARSINQRQLRDHNDRYLRVYRENNGVEWLDLGGVEKKTILLNVFTKDNSHPLPCTIRIGKTTRNQLTSMLGRPSSEKSNSVIYRMPTEIGENEVEFVFARKLLQEIWWHWDVD